MTDSNNTRRRSAQDNKNADNPSRANNADATANAPTSTAAAAGKDIPPPPTDKPQDGKKLKEGATQDFAEPGSTLNPSDPNAPNYRFAPPEAEANLAGDQSIDQGTGVQPPSPMLATAPAGGGTQETDDGLKWSDELGPRGRVISVTKGGQDGPSTTYEETIPAGANDAQAAAAKERLLRRFLAA